MNTTISSQLFQKSQRIIPGGVNSPVRAFRSVSGSPLFFTDANGAHLRDADGNEFIDYVGSWGPMILGHSHPRIVHAVAEQLKRAASFGAPTEIEIKLAEKIIQFVPSIEMVRMVNSGTEATMSAIRLARAYTRREKIIKFEGCYHGHGDSFLIKAGSGAATLGVPDSPGVTRATANDTLNARYNDLESVASLLHFCRDEVAAVIVEPIVGNMGCVPPRDGFLPGLREMCTSHGVVLIFDEVMTGFRVAKGGAQERYNITPDLTTLGKIIGGGLPVGAYGGRKEIMSLVAPLGPMYQAGTLSGNPLAMTAGYETLCEIDEHADFYQRLESKAKKLTDGIAQNIISLRLPLVQQRVESMFTLFFADQPITNWSEASGCDVQKFARYFHAMLERGVYLAPSQFEAAFISIMHSDEDIERTIRANEEALRTAFSND